MYSVFNIQMIEDSFKEVLCAQFTPAEADLAIKVGFEGGKFDQIQEKTGVAPKKLKKMLYTMGDKGTMWIDPGTQDPVFKTIGLAGPGLIETGGWGNIRFPHSVKVMKALHKLEVDFAKKWLPAVGAPVARVWATPAALPKDAKPEENVAQMIKKEGYWGVSVCSCRLPHWIADPGNHCDHMIETCLFMGEMARWGVERGMCREITYEEAVEILHKSNENGLVHTHDPEEFICNCCHDCCVFFVGIRETGAKILEPSEFIPQFDSSTCSTCGLCADRCPVDAIEVDECADVDLEKCLGCGVCFPTCPGESIQFVRRPEKVQ
jgi:Pyruvate/2-oxoacid:ferredoxin oxidoreductase delta subunit